MVADRLQQECDYINKTVSGANGFELPHNNTSWIFNTWDFLWDGHSILLIYKKKQIACLHNQNRHLTGPLSCLSWWLLKLWVVFLFPPAALTGRLQTPPPTHPTQAARCQDQSGLLGRLVRHSLSCTGNKIQVCTEVFPSSLHISAVCGTLCRRHVIRAWREENTGRGVKCCLLMRTLDECLTEIHAAVFQKYWDFHWQHFLWPVCNSSLTHCTSSDGGGIAGAV